MTLSFILDENVIILAAKRENDRGEYDLTCFQLLVRILDICYPLVMDDGLRGKWLRQLSNLLDAQPGLSPVVIDMLKQAMRRLDKVPLYPDSPPFHEETHIPQGSRDDVPIARLAVATSAVLVTTDAPLISDLAVAGVVDRYRLRVVTPEEALALL